MMLAAIDLGTVTSRLLIGEVNGGQVEVLKRSIIITDLGEGLAHSGRISDAAYERLVGALTQFSVDITQSEAELLNFGDIVGVMPRKIVATSAMRDAANASEVLGHLEDLGFLIEVISGSREAELSFWGTLSGFPDFDSTVMSIDIGGGSTELIVGESGLPTSRKPRILTSHSFDVGSRRVTEMFLKSDPPKSHEIEKARKWIEGELVTFCSSLSHKPSELIAVAGTATSAITIRDRIKVYDSSAVHGKRMSAQELDAIIATLAALPLEERRQVTGLHPGRAPVIIGGLITLAVLLSILGRDSVLVSDTDILQGILLDEHSLLGAV